MGKSFRKTGAFGIIFLLILGGFIGLMSFKAESGQAGTRSGSILYVGGTGGGNYSTIQEAVDAASPGDTVFVYSGTYIENIKINITINLIGEDKNNTIIDGGGTGFVVKVNSNSVIISNLTIQNSGEDKYDAGIILYNSENCIISNNNISDNNENGILLQELSENNKINNNDIFNNTVRGIYLHTSNLNFIKGNYFSKNGIGIELKSSDHNLILNNDLKNNGRAIYLTSSINNSIIDNTVIKNHNGVRLRQSSFNNNIINNNISYSLEYGILLNSAPGTNISDNIFISNNKPGIHILNCQNNYIFNNIFIRDGIFVQSYDILDFNTHVISRNNLVNGKPIYYYKNCSAIRINGISVGQLIIVNCSDFEINNLTINNTIFGINILYSKNGNIQNNEFSYNFDNGVYVSFSSNITISNNYIHSNNDRGILIKSSTNNKIISNDIHSNGFNGIDLLSYDNNILMNNSIHSNQRNGISLMYFGDNIISGNNIYNNEENGIHLYNSNNNLIKANIVTSNDGIGIYIDSSEFNKIYNNNIYSHTSQAFNDNNGTNFWNDTYPTGGNYWSDYAGIDLKSGLNQSQPGSDDIGDIPYNNIDGGGGAQDHYPLMKPFDIESVEFSTPSKPKNLKANAGNGFIYLSWSLPESDGGFQITNYIIHRGTISGSETYHGKIGNQLFYNDTTLANGITYYYQVSAVNAIGEGPLSIEVNATPQSVIFPFTGNISYVGGSGPGNYTRIQDAIDNASRGSTVFVFDDSSPYYENIEINKTINLIGENKENTLIFGYNLSVNRKHVIDVKTDQVYINDFTISINERFKTGININSSSNTTITNCILQNNHNGIFLDNSSYNNIFGCEIFNNDYGIVMRDSSYNVFRNNTIYSNTRNFGIEGYEFEHYYQDVDISNTVNNKSIYFLIEHSNLTLDGSLIDIGYLTLISCRNITIKNVELNNNLVGITLINTTDINILDTTISTTWWGIKLMGGTSKVKISNCNISNNGYGIDLGWYSTDVVISNCDIFNNEREGIWISMSSNNTIMNSTISNNRDGIFITYYSLNNTIRNCIISDNDIGINIIDKIANDNVIYNNLFLNNRLHARSQGGNFWDDGARGNYWDDYIGNDSNGDGIGDWPYSIYGIYSKDNYPLMDRWDIEITLELDKSEFYFDETISGSIVITNNYPFDISLNDLPWQIMVGIFFNITSLDDNNYLDAVYNRSPIEVRAQSTLTITFDLYEMNTLSPEASGSVLLNLPVGNYTIFSYFYHETSASYEVIETNAVNFKIIDETSPPPDDNSGIGGGSGSGTDDYTTTIIFASTAGLVLLLIILTLFVTATEIGKYKFASMFVAPLYSRELKKRKKKDDLVRGKIIGYVIGNPGDNYNTIKLKLKLTNGALAYHLKILEKKEEIRSERDGINRRFYPFEGRVTEEVIELSRLQKRIFNLIKRKPGITQTEISKQLGESVQKINYHIQMMVNARVIKLERKGKHSKCYVIDKIS